MVEILEYPYIYNMKTLKLVYAENPVHSSKAMLCVFHPT